MRKIHEYYCCTKSWLLCKPLKLVIKLVFFLITYAILPEPTARSAVRRGLLIPHGYLHPGKSKHSEVLRSAKFINDCGRVAMVRRSRSMGGHLTDLINMADCHEWKGQRFKKIYVRKTTQHEEKFF